MSDIKPNEEQTLAIKHSGGVLLEAGAGSGKTTVIIEHILYLLEKFIEKSAFENELSFQKKLLPYLGKIVVMTFTNKASGELKARLYNAVEKKVLSSQTSGISKEKLGWNIIKEHLSYLFVGTIHGLCLKLISGGHLPEISSECKIINKIKHRKIIEDIFERWALYSLNNLNQVIREIILMNKEQIISGFINIFEKPDLRILWKNLKDEEIDSPDEKLFIKDFQEVFELNSLFHQNHELVTFDGKKIPAWVEKVNSIKAYLNQNEFQEIEDLFKFLDFLKPIRLAASGQGSEVGKDFFKEVSKVRECLKKYQDDFQGYLKGRESVYKDYFHSLKSIFDYIEESYQHLNDKTFSDLEYYTYLGLLQKKNREKISKIFNYYIVDEFQDTSRIQFDIIKFLIGDNFNQLFCVGDIKQAIYGFRGGELAVIKDCANLIPKNLTLSNNYRSAKNIIEFNNDFFERVLNTTFDYESRPESFIYHPGHFPPVGGNQEMGYIHVLRGTISGREGERATGESEIDFWEGKALLKIIKDIRLNYPDEKICVLYKTLSQSEYLTKELMDSKIGFTSQIKVPIIEDPLVGIFKILLDLSMSIEFDGQKNRPLNYAQILLKSYLLHLNCSHSKEIIRPLEQFLLDLKVVDLFLAVQKFIFTLELSTSNFKNNFEIIKEICQVSSNDVEKAHKYLDKFSDTKNSVDFHYGEHYENVLIMTVHKSKGLEFDHILCGGIHTNGRVNNDHAFMGLLPGSFKYTLDASQKKSFKGPMYILEEGIEAKKNFDESQRLFYVALTRAKKGIYLVDLSDERRELSFNKNSWINAFRLIAPTFTNNPLITSDIEFNFLEEKTSSSFGANNLPLFHRDTMGTIPKSINKLSKDTLINNLGVTAELSVTRLITLGECPRKFYLLNICKINDESLERLNIKKNVSREIKNNEDELFDEEDLPVSSNASRGNVLHQKLSKFINEDFNFNGLRNDEGEIEIFKFVDDYFSQEKEGYFFESERPIKFSFYGQMISGIPDLILRPKEKNNQWIIVDFKSGIGTEDNVSYWLQLQLYAYALYQLGKVPLNKKIKILLMFLDKKNVQEKIVEFNDLNRSLFTFWSKLESLNQVNKSHCEFCTFGNLCHS